MTHPTRERRPDGSTLQKVTQRLPTGQNWQHLNTQAHQSFSCCWRINKRRAEGDARPGEGRGVQWEARQIRNRIHADQDAGLREVLPVVLPGCSAADIPEWLAPSVATYYTLTEFTVAGRRRCCGY